MLQVGELVARLRTDNSEFEQGLDDGEQSFASFGDRLGGLAAAAGAAAAVAFGAALVGGLSQQQVGGKVAANFGETAAEAGRYGKLAGEIYSDAFGESVADVGDALSAIRRQGLIDASSSDADIKAITEQAMTLADVFGQDVTGSAQAAAQMIRNGLAKDASEAFDVITFGIQNGVNKSDDLLDTFNEYSTKFRDLGLDAKTALGLMSQGLQAGARDSDTLADSLKEFAIRARDGSTTSAAGFKALGLNAKQMTAMFAAGGPQAQQGLDMVLDRLRAMTDPVARNTAAVALFGTKAEDLGNALFALDPTTATNGMDKLAGATNAAGDAAYNNAATKFESFKRTVKEGFVNIVGTKVIPAIEKFAGWLQKAGEWISKNKEGMGPLLVFLGTFAGIILAIVAAMKIWSIVTAAYTTIQWALNAAMLANPIGLIIIAVVALVAAILWLWFHSASFRDFLIGMWSAIWGFLKAVGAWFAGPFANFFVAAWQVIVNAALWLWNMLKTIWGGIVAGWNWLANAASSVFGAIKNFIVGAFNGAVAAVKGAINTMIGLINGVINGINGIINTANKVPGVNLPRLPNVPRLAQGGKVYPSAGGRPVIMGDGGQVEYGVPRDDMRRIIADAVRAGRSAAGGTLRVIIEGRGLLRGLRRETRAQGGDVSTVLVGA